MTTIEFKMTLNELEKLQKILQEKAAIEIMEGSSKRSILNMNALHELHLAERRLADKNGHYTARLRDEERLTIYLAMNGTELENSDLQNRLQKAMENAAKTNTGV